jgi:hypothetical protein
MGKTDESTGSYSTEGGAVFKTVYIVERAYTIHCMNRLDGGCIGFPGRELISLYICVFRAWQRARRRARFLSFSLSMKACRHVGLPAC